LHAEGGTEMGVCLCPRVNGSARRWKWSSVRCESWIPLLRVGAACTIACLFILFSVFLRVLSMSIHIVNADTYENCVRKNIQISVHPKREMTMLHLPHIAIQKSSPPLTFSWGIFF
jgi:hypothetical protein